MDILMNRRSVRRFTEQKVEPEKIDRLMRVAMEAPSAQNQQPWEFIVIDEKEKIEKLSEFSPYSGLLKGAPLAVVILERQGNRAQRFAPQDLGACTENLLLGAVEQGLGAVWMGVGKDNPRETFLIDMFNLPERVKPFAVIAIGYPAEENANRFVDRYEAERVHYNKF